MGEPVAASLLPTPHLTDCRAWHGPVVGHDVALCQLAGSHLEVLTALGSRGGGVPGGGGGCRGWWGGWSRRPGAGGEVRRGWSTGAALTVLLLTTPGQHVALRPEVSEPVTSLHRHALGLAGGGRPGVAVVTEDVVLSQLGGGLLLTHCRGED